MHHGVSDPKLAAVALVDGVALAGLGHRAKQAPSSRAPIDHIARVAIYDQLAHPGGRCAEVVAAAGPAQAGRVGGSDRQHRRDLCHVGCACHQAVVAAAGQVDALYRGDAYAAGVGDGIQVEDHAGTVKLDRVEAAAAIDLGRRASGQRRQVAGVEHHDVVARTAVEQIGAAPANQGVMAGAAHQGFVGRGAGQGIGQRSAQLVHVNLPRGAVAGAKNHITATCIGSRRRVAQVGADDQVGQAIAVDIACGRYAGAAAITCALAVDDKADSPAKTGSHRREFNSRTTGLAKHHIAHAGIGATR